MKVGQDLQRALPLYLVSGLCSALAVIQSHILDFAYARPFAPSAAQDSVEEGRWTLGQFMSVSLEQEPLLRQNTQETKILAFMSTRTITAGAVS